MAEPILDESSARRHAFTGGGDMGALLRAKDWSRTALGPVERWPWSLRSSVSTCINSRFPIIIWWGPELVMLYNDAYAVILGAKHPSALGTRGPEVWPEIWPTIGPMLAGVLERGEATWSENIRLFLERNGFAEETYFTFSYSPIRDQSGGVVGVFSAVSETSKQVIGERRLKTLRELAERTAGIDDDEGVCTAAVEVLRANQGDVAFSQIYLVDGGAPELVCSTQHGLAIDPAVLAEVTREGKSRILPGLDIPADVEGMPPAHQALILPIARPGEPAPAGVLIAGLSPRLTFDDSYRGFLELAAGQIATAIATARAFEETRRRAEALAEIDRAKTAFFSNVSHEFRTPLTLMLGPLDDLLRGDAPLDADTRAQLALLHRNALRLLKLVNTLLDFSRLEAGRVQASYQPTDLAALTADLASVFRSAIERAGLAFRIDCPPLREPAWVDREMWEKIVLNLVANAFKFTHQGQIAVSLREAGDRIELAVADTGIGIAEKDQARLFERFHRIEGAHGRTQEGTGIGLALAYELVKLHGGTVQVESAPGRGSTFIVGIPAGNAHLPKERIGAQPSLSSTSLGAAPFVDETQLWSAGSAPPPPQRSSLAAPAPAGGPRQRVLIADDNADMREYLRRLLAQRCEVEVAADGVTALEAVRARRPDLVLSDVMMPGLDGFALLRELRADPETAPIPVILLSARAGEEALVEGRTAGADDYVVKPFSAKELLARVESQLALSRLRRVGEVQRSELRRLFQHAPVFITLMRGPRHVFELANDAYLQLVGGRELVGKSVREAFPELEGQGFFELIDDVYSTGKPYVGKEVHVRLRHRGDAQADVYITFTYEAFRDLDGRIDGVMVFGFDVTEMVSARRRTEALAAQAQLADRRKDEFLAMLGHELRNPLAPIATAVKLMELRGDDSSRRERQVIERQVAHLSRLVDDLLDVSRIAHGKIELSRRVVDVAEVAAKAVEQASPIFEVKSHELSLQVPRGELRVLGDPVRLAQVIGNLLTNAAKYTPPRGHVQLSATREDGQVVIRVRDNGIGMPAEFLPHAFELFVQSKRALDRSDGGLGLGLSVVKSLVTLHGGTVSAHSAGADRGSEFVVRLPAHEGAAVASAHTSAAARTRRATGRVLIVDDNVDAAEILGETLATLGHEVAVAHDGPQALSLQAEFRPDIGVLDLGLPVMDGYELAARMRQSSPIRLIALTGYGQDHDRERSRGAGFDAHLVKPVEIEELAKVISALQRMPPRAAAGASGDAR